MVPTFYKGGNNFSTNMVWLCSVCKDKLEQVEDERIKEKQKCINCGKQADNKHHVVPRSLGGNNSTNCVWLCDDCHSLVHGITVNNGTLSHSDLIKIGIQKARESGKEIGRPNVVVEDLEWFKPYYQEILNGKRALKIKKGFEDNKCVEKLCRKCEYKESV